MQVLRTLMAAHVAQGGMVLFTSHQPVALLTQEGQEVPVLRYRLQVPQQAIRSMT